jgi:hypothetical protein
MLDVHSIHAPVRGWRDFSVQIATIVVGLCIAVGLQQTVEAVRNHYQLNHIREALRMERQENHTMITYQSAYWRQTTAELQNNLLVFHYLEQHPGTSQDKLPGILLWDASYVAIASAVWDAAHQNGAIALIPRNEIEEDALAYRYLEREYETALEVYRAVLDSSRFILDDADPSHLSPVQIAMEIELTQVALTKQFLLGRYLVSLTHDFPDFPATLSNKDLMQLIHTSERPMDQLLGRARSLTLERVKASGFLDPVLNLNHH